MNAEPKRVASLAELDALVGLYVAHEHSETYWEDSHGCFQFNTEIEARQALADPYYQRFLPDVDWSRTVIREVRRFSAWSTSAEAAWRLVEKASARFGPMLMWREHGRWHAAFGSHADADARSPQVAICLAALSAAGVRTEVEHDRLDAQANALAATSSAAQA